MSEPILDERGERRSAAVLGRLASVLATIFPPAPEPDRSRREWAWALGVAAAVGLLTVARAPFKFDQFWAEDGTVFLGGAINDGRWASFDDWYAGYLHAVPRLLGAIAASLPLRWAPAVFFAGVVLITAAGAGLVMYRSSAYIERRWLRVLLAAVPAILPTMGVEVLGNAANLQFLLVYFAFWILLWLPRTWATTVVASIAALLIALSTALVVFLVPLALARLLVRRGWRLLVPPLALLLGTAAQLVGRQLAGADRGDLGIEPVDLVGALDAFTTMAGANLHASLPEPAFDPVRAVLVVVSVATVLAMAFGARAQAGRSEIPPAVARTMVGLSLGMGAGIWLTLALAFGVTTRYAVLASFFLAAGLVVAIDLALTASPSLLLRVPAFVLLAAFALAVVRGWPPMAWHDEPGRAWSHALDAAETSCRTTDAEWAVLPLSPGSWSVFLRCDVVLATG